MIEWFNKLSNVAQATLVGAIIGAVMAILIAAVTVVFKDFLLPLLFEKRLLRAKSSYAFKKYSSPLILASISFLFRIKEVFVRGHFLLNHTPKNYYNEYKYLSTMYRLCSLLGWIRAIKIELSHIEVKSTKEFIEIESAMNNFEKSLADGMHIEISRVEHLCRIWNLNFQSLTLADKNHLGTEIENLVDRSTFSVSVETAKDLDDSAKYSLVRQISNLVCAKTKSLEITEEVLKQNMNIAIQEMCRVEAWIYRDWQAAIGDLMIKKSQGEDRKYDVVSYLEFENMCFEGDANTKKWLKRVELLFLNLDVKIEDRFDARKQQLRQTYNSTVELMKTFSKISGSKVDLIKQSLKQLEGKV